MCTHHLPTEKVCANPACGVTFTPHRRRIQVYCTRKCGINYNNDKKHYANKEQAHWPDPVRACEATLKELVQSDLYIRERIKESDLIRFRIDPTLVKPREHLKTKGYIYWFGAYGIEQLKPAYKKLYTIYYRTNL